MSLKSHDHSSHLFHDSLMRETTVEAAGCEEIKWQNILRKYYFLIKRRKWEEDFEESYGNKSFWFLHHSQLFNCFIYLFLVH